MYNTNLLYGNQNINSVISNCSLVEAFNQVLNYFDPNKNKNYKSKILDCSYSLMWTEKDMKMYNLSHTKNLTGNVLSNKYDIIIYEPPRNKTFFQDAQNSSKIFNKVLNTEGLIITKTNDFKEKGSNQLFGSFELYDIFTDSGFYLQDNIVYNFNKQSILCETFNRAKIIHLYFMIFKKKQGEIK